MTVDLVPRTDLAPTLPSRVVTVNVSEMTKGAPSPDFARMLVRPAAGTYTVTGATVRHIGDGAWEIQQDIIETSAHVRFTLVGDIPVPANLVTVGALRSMSVPLGGSIRLPCWTGAHGDWHILVRKSWAPYAYAIRPPEGATPIDLSQIPPLQGGAL